MPAPKIVQDLVDRFDFNKNDYKGPAYKESNLRSEFLDPFFQELGWDLTNSQGFSEKFKEVRVEPSVEVEGRKKSADYEFRIGGQRIFFAEAKKPSVDLLSDKQAALQIRRYGWSAKLPVCILTDFEELVFYDTSFAPKPSDGARTARIRYFSYKDYIDRWDEIYRLISREAVLKGYFDVFSKDKAKKYDKSELDDDFLKWLEGTRLKVGQHIFKKNNLLELSDVQHVTQLLIDRLLFCRICEDRQILGNEQLLKISGRKEPYKVFLKYCEDLQAKFNSSLFSLRPEKKQPAYDQISSTLTVDDVFFKDLLAEFYYPNSPYVFSVVSSDLLGAVYEKFLESEVKIIEGKIISEKKPELRKKTGVFYTPTKITEYLVKNALHFKLQENKTRPKIRILDPACGSGSFLLAAYEQLLDWYLNWHLTVKTKRAVEWITAPDGSKTPHLTLNERKRILSDHIFGIDIDEKAVEVTRLSLFLKLTEDDRVLPVQDKFLALADRILPDMTDNIICGNATVHSDILAYTPSLSQDEIFKINPLNTKSEKTCVKTLMNKKFDVILQNPPYAYRTSTDKNCKDYYEKKYQCHEGNYDLYKYFLEMSINALRSNGVIAGISNASFLIQDQFKKLREIIDAELNLKELCFLGSSAIPGATIDTALLIAQKNKSKRQNKGIKIKERMRAADLESIEEYSISQTRFSGSNHKVFDWRLTDDQAEEIDKIFHKFKPATEFVKFSVGINTGTNTMSSQILADSKKGVDWHPCINGRGIVSRYGPVSHNGYVRYDPLFVRGMGKHGRTLPPREFFDTDKILIVRTRNTALERRIIATIDSGKGYNLNRLSNIIVKPGTDLHFTLGIFNSELFQKIMASRFFNYEIKPVFLKKLPMPGAQDDLISELVKERMEKEKEFLVASTDRKKTSIHLKIAVIENQIDERVYELFEVDRSKI